MATKNGASPKRSRSVGGTMVMAKATYLKMAERAGILSRDAYILSVVCADLGLHPENIDVMRTRRSWRTQNLPPMLRFPFFLHRDVYDAVKRKLASLPYPVEFAPYVRSLIERDVAERKIKLPPLTHNRRYIQAVERARK